jgi:hypothetical protein
LAAAAAGAVDSTLLEASDILPAASAAAAAAGAIDSTLLEASDILLVGSSR